MRDGNPSRPALGTTAPSGRGSLAHRRQLRTVPYLASRRPDISGPSGLVTVLFIGAVRALWLGGLYRRLNWLRWLTIASPVLTVAIALLTWRSLIHLRQNIVLMALILAAWFDSGVVLLCLPQASRWYTRKTDDRRP